MLTFDRQYLIAVTHDSLRCGEICLLYAAATCRFTHKNVLQDV